jgi:hypothetical protein
MKKYSLPTNIEVFGIQVKTFPLGIGEAFEALAEKLSEGYDRAYYGLSKMSSEGILYIAAAEEKYEYEAEKYNYERYTIEKGEYVAKVIKDWRLKMDSIKEIFTEMMNHPQFDDHKYCVEWYKDDHEMICMAKLKY